jgi:hypothetical protein
MSEQGVTELPKLSVAMWITLETNIVKPLTAARLTAFCYGDDQCLPWLISNKI